MAEKLYSIGTVGMMGKPCLAKVNLGNVDVNSHADNYDTAGVRNNWIEEYFWKK